MITTTFLPRFETAYLECALWASIGDDGESLDGFYTPDDLDPASLARIRQDCEGFIEAQRELLRGLEPEQCGHDFWLTRNGHGAGFWDRGLGLVGRMLTDACKPYGETDLVEVLDADGRNGLRVSP